MNRACIIIQGKFQFKAFLFLFMQAACYFSMNCFPDYFIFFLYNPYRMKGMSVDSRIHISYKISRTAAYRKTSVFFYSAV